ncbi:MAG TPA: GIY-YIG nuclease family protein [Chitinophagales bacterium]|nr:GIY-YIG nuclease family protein [Chitinophagales bacterium]
MKGCGIYIMKWENNPYFYIGKSKNLEARYQQYLSYINRDYRINAKVDAIITQYGKPKFEVLELCSIEYLNDCENKHLANNKDSEYILNIRLSNGYSKLTTIITIGVTEEENELFKNLVSRGFTRREAIVECLNINGLIDGRKII